MSPSLQVTLAAEREMASFLAAAKDAYPDLHAVLACGSNDYAVGLLCAVGAWQARAAARQGESLC